MKTVLLILLMLISQMGFAQRYLFSNEEKQWMPKDFTTTGVKKVSAYKFKVKANGKIKKDSTLIYRQEYDINSRKIYGIKTSHMYYSHGPVISTLETFERNYNTSSQLIHEYTEPLQMEPKRHRGLLSYENSASERINDYDENGNLVKETYIGIEKDFTLTKEKDTLDYIISKTPQIFEYVYADNKLVSKFGLNDSTTTVITWFFEDKQIKKYNSCYSCSNKQKFYENTYNKNGQLQLTTILTREGAKHSKKYYYYNEDNQIMKRIDSTGWYINNRKPYVESTTVYDYNSSGKTITKTEFPSNINAHETYYIQKFDSVGNLISDCTTTDKIYEYCSTYSYTFDTKIKSVVEVYEGKNYVILFKYNDRGQLIEERKSFPDMRDDVIKYYYE